jgi:hypothetical protein
MLSSGVLTRNETPTNNALQPSASRFITLRVESMDQIQPEGMAIATTASRLTREAKASLARIKAP